MNKKFLIFLASVAATAGAIYFGKRLWQDTAPVTSMVEQQQGAPTGVMLTTNKDTLLLTENGRVTAAVLFDSTLLIRNGYLGLFDTLVSKTDLYSNSQLNYQKNKAIQLRAIVNNDEKQGVTDFLKETSTAKATDTLPLRQLLFRVVLDTVRKAEKAGLVALVNDNKEIVKGPRPEKPATPAAVAENTRHKALLPLLICTGILSLLTLAAVLYNKKNMATRRKKTTESEEDYLKRAVYDLLGKDTAEARYFTEVLANHKRYQAVKDQLKPEGKPDTGTLINNMKDAGLLTAGESRTMYELHELKEKIAGLKPEGATNVEKQQHLMTLLQSMTKDEPLKQHLQQSAAEGLQWQQLMNLDEKALPAALQNMLRFYDEKYGNGTHRLSPLYADILRQAQLEIPENFAKEDRFLKALYEQYRGLLDDVLYTWFAQQHSPEKLAEARQAFVNRLAQLAFHAHSFLVHYNRDTAALPPATGKTNMQLVVEGTTIPASLSPDTYRTYSRDITRFEREIFLQKLLAGIGVTNLENVLIKDVYYKFDNEIHTP